MSNWFECKVKYDKTVDGVIKKVSEAYLVDALSFTEAEARITEEQKPFISGDFVIATVKRSRIAEIAFSEDEGCDRWYMAKIGFVEINERTGAEKRIVVHYLIQCKGFKDAYDRLLDYMKGSMQDYDILSISETPLLDVYRMKVKD